MLVEFSRIVKSGLILYWLTCALLAFGRIA
jgi:hypothetical protein